MKCIYSARVTLLFLLVLIAPFHLLSKKVLPEFANEWYDAQKDIKRDSCWIPHFQYHLKALTKMSLLKILLHIYLNIKTANG